MLFSLFFCKLLSLILYVLIAIIIWDVITRRFLIEKIFSLILVFFLLSFWLLLNGLEFLPLVILLLYIGAIAVLFLFVVMILNPDLFDVLQRKNLLLAQLQGRQVKLSAILADTNNLINLKQKTSWVLFYKTMNHRLNNLLTTKTIYSSVNTTDNSFVCLGLLIGIFGGALVSIYTYFQFQFVNALSEVQKLMQLFSIKEVENNLENQLGQLTEYSVNTFSSIKIQAYYHPTIMNKEDIINIGLLLYTKYGVALLIIGVMLLVSMMGAIILTLRQTTLLKKQSITLQSRRYTM